MILSSAPSPVRSGDIPAEVAGAPSGGATLCSGTTAGGGGQTGQTRRRSHFFEGFAAGVEAFRLVGAHAIPGEHPHGSTPEGRDWFLGCVRGLEQCEATFRGVRPHNPTTTKR